jgi:hypothetical protein
MTFNKVVLPHPEAPSATTNSSGSNSRWIPSRAVMLPPPVVAGKTMLTSLRLRTAGMKDA